MLLVYGWIQQNINDNVPLDTMAQTLKWYRDNTWIRPNIHCTDQDTFTTEQVKTVENALFYCHAKGKSLNDIVSETRIRLASQRIGVLIMKRTNWASNRLFMSNVNTSS